MGALTVSVKIAQPNRESSKVPTEPGYYIAFFTLGPQLISIIEIDGQLRNINGAVTHFTRWNALWSDKLEFV